MKCVWWASITIFLTCSTTAPAQEAPLEPDRTVHSLGRLLSPRDKATGVSTSPVFAWASTGDNSKHSYHFQLSTSAAFTGLLCDSSGVADTTLRMGWLSGNTKYYWRVLDSSSTAWSFTTLTGPYTGSRIVIPGTLEVESYDADGEGVSYHDMESDNYGSASKYRTAEGVDVERCQDPEGGSFNIGWTKPGEWTRYSISVKQGGFFRMDARVATVVPGQFHLELNGADISGPVRYGPTGGWQNWTTVTDTVHLPVGDHFLFLKMDTTLSEDDGNINQLRFSPVDMLPPTLTSPVNGSTGVPTSPIFIWTAAAGAESYRIQLSTDPSFNSIAYDSSGFEGTSHKVEWLSGATQYWWRVFALGFGSSSEPSTAWKMTTLTGPYSGSFFKLPGTVEVAQYDAGGEGISYHDSDPENLGAASKYRTAEGVDVQRCQDPNGSPYNVGWTVPGEWLKYSVNITQGGPCRMDARVATPWTGLFHLELDGEDLTGPVYYGNTGGWQSWITVSDTVDLPPGNHELTLVLDDTASSYHVGNINQLQFTPLDAPMAVNLLSPPNGATKQPATLTLAWHTVAGANWYDLQCGIDTLLTYVRVDTFRVMSLLQGTRYLWRVRAHNLTGYGQFSPTWSFSTEYPVPGQIHLNATSLVTADSCIFSWKKEPVSTRYWFEISSDSLFNAFSSIDSVLTDTAKNVHGLENGRVYFWRVRGGNGGGWGEFSPTGSVHVVINSVAAQHVPTDFVLRANYPNPFNPRTTIGFELPISAKVRLSVFDMLGREVAVLVNERKSAGVYEVSFNAEGLSSGIYIYRLHAGDFMQSRKIVLLK
jgi:hypothetical protein